MVADDGIVREVLALVPQQEPFRFIDEIISLNEEEIIGAYRFRADAFFYRGHFPGRPITPGVILIDTMARWRRRRSTGSSPPSVGDRELWR